MPVFFLFQVSTRNALRLHTLGRTRVSTPRLILRIRRAKIAKPGCERHLFGAVIIAGAIAQGAEGEEN